VSLLNGEKIGGAEPVETMNALGDANGNQINALAPQVRMLKGHISTFQSPYTDLRRQMRTIEEKLLTDHAGFLIGNQCIDFQKQDGVTEIEESIMANTVERRLNDLLFRDEGNGKVRVNRQPIYVSCVSNFTNFLDLFRKTIRSLEVGIPCIVLGRSNTAQHSYRWTKLLLDLMVEEGIDPGMITFLACTLDDIKDITHSCQENTGNLYTTCSRQLAAQIKSTYPKTVASTGGPNTLVAMELTRAVQDAIQTSASIECAGQCTALRHCVVPPSTDPETLEHIFDLMRDVPEAPRALTDSIFDGIFAKHKGSKEPDGKEYQHHWKVDVYFRVSDDLPPPGINEFWRKVVVDFSRIDPNDEKQLDRLAAWLNENQPISLAVNGPREKALKLGMALFRKTGMVVNTIGSSDHDDMPPALTCQARPQEAEVFGEFPPRSALNEYTRFPVVVPSSNPSYDTVYTEEFLRMQQANESFSASTKSLIDAAEGELVRGYSIAVIRYLQDVARQNPKIGFGKSRTAVWGLQRIPADTKTVIRCHSTSTWDSICPIYMLFHTTNARTQIELSVEPSNANLIGLCNEHKLPHTVETESCMTDRLRGQSVFNLVHVDKPMTSFPMVGNFSSLYLPLGHIKSTKANDEEFQLLARLSDKWLNTLF